MALAGPPNGGDRVSAPRHRGPKAGLGITDKRRALLRGEAEFAAVNGVGAAKLKQFAGPFLAAIEAALADTGDGAPSTEGAAVTRQVVITEKASQAMDVRAAVGSRYGTVLAAEGHLLDLYEPEDVNPAWKRWVDGTAAAGRTVRHQNGGGRQQGGEAEGDPGGAGDGRTGCGWPPTATARDS